MKKYKLSDVCDILVGFPFKSEFFETGNDGIKLVRGMNVSQNGLRWGDQIRRWTRLTQELDPYYLAENDVVIAMDGNVGKNMALIRHDDLPLLLVQRVARLRAKFIPQRFVWLLVNNRTFRLYLDSVKTGTTISHISAKQIGEYEFELPDDFNFEKGMELVCGLEDKIYFNDKIAINLESQIRSYFKKRFLDSDSKYSWKLGNFDDIVCNTLGGDWGKAEPDLKNNTKVYCVRGADIPDLKSGKRGKIPFRFIPEKNFLKKSLKPGDLIVEISGGSPTQSTGRIAAISDYLLHRYDDGMVCTNFCRAITPKKGYSFFIYYYWQYLYDIGLFFNYENGTTGIKNFDLNGFLSQEEIYIPPIDELAEFNEMCLMCQQYIFNSGIENDRLEELRTSMLPRLFLGDIIC